MPTPVADPAAIAAVQDILKEVWTTDALQSQLLEELVLFDWMDDVTEFTDSDGLAAAVPLRTGRTGGIGTRGIGEKLPPAGHQRVGKAKYNYTFHYLTVKVLGPVVARMKTQRQSVVKEISLEVENGLDDIKQDWQRQLHGDGTAVICTVAVSTTSTTVTVQGRKGTHALEVGWIYEGMRIDIGTAANPVLTTQGVTVQSVDPDAGTFEKPFVGDPHALPNKVDFLNKKSFQMYSAGDIAWQNQTTGGDILAWVQDEDAFVARAAKYWNIGTPRRGALGSLQDLDHA
jgi:hypothetical protein